MSCGSLQVHREEDRSGMRFCLVCLLDHTTGDDLDGAHELYTTTAYEIIL